MSTTTAPSPRTVGLGLLAALVGALYFIWSGDPPKNPIDRVHVDQNLKTLEPCREIPRECLGFFAKLMDGRIVQVQQFADLSFIESHVRKDVEIIIPTNDPAWKRTAIEYAEQFVEKK